MKYAPNNSYFCTVSNGKEIAVHILTMTNGIDIANRPIMSALVPTISIAVIKKHSIEDLAKNNW